MLKSFLLLQALPTLKNQLLSSSTRYKIHSYCKEMRTTARGTTLQNEYNHVQIKPNKYIYGTIHIRIFFFYEP